jgi:hypothetical protein
LTVFAIACVTVAATVTTCPTFEGFGVCVVTAIVVPTGLIVRSTLSVTVVKSAGEVGTNFTDRVCVPEVSNLPAAGV